jgi:hypothetical protein
MGVLAAFSDGRIGLMKKWSGRKRVPSVVLPCYRPHAIQYFGRSLNSTKDTFRCKL